MDPADGCPVQRPRPSFVIGLAAPLCLLSLRSAQQSTRMSDRRPECGASSADEPATSTKEISQRMWLRRDIAGAMPALPAAAARPASGLVDFDDDDPFDPAAAMLDGAWPRTVLDPASGHECLHSLPVFTTAGSLTAIGCVRTVARGYVRRQVIRRDLLVPFIPPGQAETSVRAGKVVRLAVDLDFPGSAGVADMAEYLDVAAAGSQLTGRA